MADFKFEKPFVSLLGSRTGSMVDLRGHYSNFWHGLAAQLHDLVSNQDST